MANVCIQAIVLRREFRTFRKSVQIDQGSFELEESSRFEENSNQTRKQSLAFSNQQFSKHAAKYFSDNFLS